MTDIEEAIRDQVCPQWIMESKSILGRCVPSINETVFTNSDIGSGTGGAVTWTKLKKYEFHSPPDDKYLTVS